MAGITEKGLAAGASLAGRKALRYAKEGRYRQALAWSVPLVFAGMAVWYIRRGGRPHVGRRA